MIKEYDIALVVGTRPNFVKAAPLLKKLENKNKKVLFIHTGQHFDKTMSNNIFTDLNMRDADLNLNAPTDSQSNQFQFIVKELINIFKNNFIIVFNIKTTSTWTIMRTSTVQTLRFI